MELAVLFENWQKRRMKHKQKQTTGQCKTCGGLTTPSGKSFLAHKICKRCHGYIKRTLLEHNIEMDVQDVVDSIDVMNELEVAIGETEAIGTN